MYFTTRNHFPKRFPNFGIFELTRKMEGAILKKSFPGNDTLLLASANLRLTARQVLLSAVRFD